MPWWIHLIAGSEGLRSHVWYPKRCRTQWIVHSHIEGHCWSRVLWEFHAPKTFLWATRWLWQCCSGQKGGIRWGSSLNRSHHIWGSQFLPRWICPWHTSAMDGMELASEWGVLQHSGPGTGCRSHIAKLLLLWPCLCLARRHIHKWTTVLWWFLDGTGEAVVAPSPFLMEGQWGLLHVGQGHLQWWGSPNVAIMGIMDEGLPWCHGSNQWWSCWWEHASQGHSQRLVGMLPSSLGTGKHGGWQCPVGCLVQDRGWMERVCQAGPFPYLGSNGWCNCSPGGTEACAVDRLACLPGSSGRWIPGACGLTWWWKTCCRHMLGISLPQRWKWASLFMFMYWCLVLVRALLAKATGLPFCRSAATRTTCEASTYIVTGSEGSKYLRVVSLMTASLNHWKVAL